MLDLYRTLGEPVREAHALNSVGWYAARLGDYDTARSHCQTALALHQRHDNPEGEAETLDSLGYIDHHAQAIDHYQQALALRRSLGNAYGSAGTLDHLGHSHAALGHRTQARAVWQQALELYQEQERTRDAERVRPQLDALDRE